MSSEQAVQLVARQGLSSLLQVLRGFGAASCRASQDLKRRDDASGIHLFVARSPTLMQR
jgi:hypothetical protein